VAPLNAAAGITQTRATTSTAPNGNQDTRGGWAGLEGAACAGAARAGGEGSSGRGTFPC
jgi:hypothetical protein